MKKVQRRGLVGTAMMTAALSALLVSSGCEWDGGGDGYNSRYEWADFNGVYAGYNGLKLVTDYSAKPGTEGVTYNKTESEGVTVDGKEVYSGVLDKRPVVRGSVEIALGLLNMSDDGNGALNAGPDSGTIDYGTGAWSIHLQNNGAQAGGQPITAKYQYLVSGTTPPGPGSGASGITIYTFAVQQYGQNVTLTDNNGSVYEGKVGSTRLTDGTLNAEFPVVGSTVAMQFSASGVSAAGYQVKIVGTLQGVVTDSDGISITLSDRRMYGTWIERGGKTGDINGEASPLSVIVAPVAPTDT